MDRFRSTITAVTAVVLTLSAVTAHGDGCFAWHGEDRDIREPRQKAFIAWVDGVEDLVLSVTFTGATRDFGWIVPLPAPPEVAPAAGPVFESLSRTMDVPYAPLGALFPVTLMLTTIPSPVETEHHDVGVYAIDVLRSDDGSALARWLIRHDFALPAGAEAILDPYARRGWVFAAMRIDPAQVDTTLSARLASGEIEPLRFRFPAAAPVFPLAISALGGERAVVLLYLLAEDPLVPAPAPGITWEVSLKPWAQAAGVFSGVFPRRSIRPGADRRVPVGEPYLQEIQDRLASRPEPFALTRCRASLAPHDMHDVAFVPLDPAAALADTSRVQRATVAGWLGEKGTAASASVLSTWLAGQDVLCGMPAPPQRRQHRRVLAQRDLVAALLALGQCGDPDVVMELRRWLRCGERTLETAALEAIGRIDASLAAELALPLIARGDRVGRYDGIGYAGYRLARELVIAGGGPQQVGPLRRLAWRYAMWRPWRLLWRPEFDQASLRRDAQVMIAACGDTAMQTALVRTIAAENRVWQSAADDSVTATFRDVNGLPDPAGGLVTWDQSRDLPVTRAVVKELAARPALHDTLLRQALADDALSPFAQCTLLGYLARPGSADVARLRALWTAALAARHEITIATPPSHTRIQWSDVTVTVDPDATAALFALARMRAVPALLACWDDVPWSRPELKADVLVALAQVPDVGRDHPEVQAAALRFVAEVWNSRVTAADIAATLGPGAHLYHVPFPWPADALYRHHAVLSLLSGNPHALAASLGADSPLSPVLRLALLSLLRPDADRGVAALMVADTDALRGLLTDPRLVAECDRIATLARQALD